MSNPIFTLAQLAEEINPSTLSLDELPLDEHIRQRLSRHTDTIHNYSMQSSSIISNLTQRVRQLEHDNNVLRQQAGTYRQNIAQVTTHISRSHRHILDHLRLRIQELEHGARNRRHMLRHENAKLQAQNRVLPEERAEFQEWLVEDGIQQEGYKAGGTPGQEDAPTAVEGDSREGAITGSEEEGTTTTMPRNPGDTSDMGGHMDDVDRRGESQCAATVEQVPHVRSNRTSGNVDQYRRLPEHMDDGGSDI